MEKQELNSPLHLTLLKLVKLERRITSQILELLQKIEDNKSYLGWGYSNLFDYLVRGLNYSESLAYQRQAALRICKEIPEVKLMLDQGRLSLTTLARATRVLSTKNTLEKQNLLQELENKSSREVDKILAREWPDHNFSPGPAKRHVKNERVQLTFEFSEDEFQLLERLKALKSHKIKDLKELMLMLAENEMEKYMRTSRYASKSKNPRQIKISLKRYLLQKAKYKCQFPGCEQTHFLQIDHINPVHKGGSNKTHNLQVLCQSHNIYKHHSDG